MRTIKFRGKSIETGEWVYGSLILGDTKSETIIVDENWIDIYVDYETVGQFTGLLDKNGREIYEGDHDADGNFVVVCNWCHCWQFGLIDIPTKDIVIGCHWCIGHFDFADHIADFEITGNIHEK